MLAYYYPQGKQRCIDGVGQLQNLGGAPQATERFSERVCHDGEGSLCLRKRTTINWASRIKAHDDTLTHTGHKIDPKRMEVCMAHTHTHTHTHTYTQTHTRTHTQTHTLTHTRTRSQCSYRYPHKIQKMHHSSEEPRVG